jgi:hypothetical protein
MRMIDFETPDRNGRRPAYFKAPNTLPPIPVDFKLKMNAESLTVFDKPNLT